MKPAPYPLDRMDALVAALSGIGAFGIYARTMAPDVLYGDSAELQTLAYALGHTHSTGYPVYLLLARLVGLFPLNNPAWRVTLFSVLMGAAAVAGTYLLSRQLTDSRAGACLAGIGLALSYTLWSQAIISEVYAPGAAFLAWILLSVLHWQQAPERRGKALFAAALLAGLSLGMHATTALAALPAAAFVLLWLAARRSERLLWQRTLIHGTSGAIVGISLWLAAFLFMDWHNPQASFIHTALFPSRTIWGLAAEDMDTPWERIALTLNSIQWKDVLFAEGIDGFQDSLVDYLSGMTGREFSGWFLLLGLYGWWKLLGRDPWRGGYLLASYGLVLFYVLNYRPGDQYVFFLASYILFVAAAGAGMGALLEGPKEWKLLARRGWGQSAAVAVMLLLLLVVIRPAMDERLPALRSGVAAFVWDGYQFPVENLREPRLLAQMHLNALPDDALVLMEWRELYALGYLAYVEGKKPGITLVEALPRGNDGQVAASMVETIQQALASGRPVYAAQRFAGLEKDFRLVPAANRYVQVLPRR